MIPFFFIIRIAIFVEAQISVHEHVKNSYSCRGRGLAPERTMVFYAAHFCDVRIFHNKQELLLQSEQNLKMMF